MKRAHLFFCLLLICFSFFKVSVSYSQESSLTKKDTSEVRFINQRKFFIYKVDKEETLFSISNKFKIPKEELEEFNPELKDGLKVKMKLWIPAYSHIKKAETIFKSNETDHRKDVFQIALITALNIPQNFSFDSTLVDSNYVNSNFSEETIANLEFYEGMLLATDSIKTGKQKIHLYVFDSENDSLKIAEHLKDPIMKTMDLMISNGNTHTTRMLNSFSKIHHIRFASIALNAGDLLKYNSEAISMLPSSLTQCRKMGKFAADKFKLANAIVLNTASSKENERAISFKKGWFEVSEKKIKNVTYSSGALKITSDSLTLFQKIIKENLLADEDNLIFVPSSNEEFVSTLVNDLKVLSDRYRITLLGLPTWQHFETIDPLLFELLNVHIFTSSLINYNSPVSLRFRKKFFDTYNVEPMDAAFQGFDQGMIVGKLFSGQEKKLADYLPGITYQGLFTNYQFMEVPGFSFFENHYIAVCKYRNYELKKIND